jgi:hypothetical protein
MTYVANPIPTNTPDNTELTDSDWETLVEAVKDDGFSAIIQYDESQADLYEYYSLDIDRLIKEALIKLDNELKKYHATSQAVFNWFNEEAGNNISIERVQCYDIDLEDFHPNDRLMMLSAMFESNFGYLTAQSMFGAGVGWFEMFDFNTPCMNSLV